MSDTADQNTLDSVRNELATLLNGIRDDLEAFAGEFADPGTMDTTNASLDSIRDALEALEYFGAATLVQEIQMLIRRMLKRQVENRRDAADVLMLSLVRLDDYLTRLALGQQDVPVVLLPYLNDLRSARKAPLITEAAFFAPDLDQPAPLFNASEDVAGIRKLAEAQRQHYQLSLVQWFRDSDASEALSTMGAVLEQLSRVASDEATHKIFWVASGLVTALQDGTLEAGSTVKQLMGRIDRAIKSLATAGDTGITDETDNEFLKNLLFSVARSTSPDERIQAIRTTFDLEHALPSDEDVHAGRAQLSAAPTDAMHAVSDALIEELAQIKDDLDLFLRAGTQQPDQLAQQIDPLNRACDTLGMIGQAELALKLRDQTETITALASSDGENLQDDLTDVAEALLFVEAALKELAGNAAGVHSPRILERDTLGETRIELGGIQAAMIAFIDDPRNTSLVAGVDALFVNIQGALSMLAMDRPAAITSRIATWINDQIHATVIDRERVVEMTRLLDDLATFIDASQERQANSESLLQQVELHLDELVARSNKSIAASADDWLAVSLSDGNAGSVSTEIDNGASLSLEALTGSFDEPLDQPSVTTDGSTAITEPAEEVIEPLADDVDEEIYEIFIEEAREVLEEICNNYPQWRTDTANSEALDTTRRAFHTLKGSGRMVKAERVSELAWSVENLFNRIIDETVTLNDNILQFLDDTIAVLPELIECQSRRAVPAIAAEALRQRGHELADPQSAVTEDQTSIAGTDAREAQEPVTPLIDPTLLEVFTNETRGHADTIAEFIDTARNEGPGTAITDGLRKAFHTLQGSARLAEVNAIADIGAALEQVSGTHDAKSLPVGSDTLDLFSSALPLIDRILEHISTGQGELPDIMLLQSHAESLCTNLRAQVALARNTEATGTRQDTEVSTEAPAEAVETPAVQAMAGLDTEMVEVFVDEAQELLETLDRTMQHWHAAPDDTSLISDLQRSLHTIKGGARLAGLNVIGDLAHALESLLTAAALGRTGISRPLLDLSRKASDRMVSQIEQASRFGTVESAVDLVEALESMTRGEQPKLQKTAPAQPAKIKSKAPRGRRKTDQPDGADRQLIKGTGHPQHSRRSYEQIRLGADVLDKFVNFAGEITLYRARLEQQNGGLSFNLVELSQTVARLRDQLRKLDIETEAQILFRFEQSAQQDEEEFDPLELDRFSNIQQLSRALAETVNDLGSIEETLQEGTRETDTLLLQQSRVSTDLQESLLRTRMVPFSKITPRLTRVVRQTADQLGKMASLEIEGAEGEMDRAILDRLTAPLEHLIRNSLSHGIEANGQRRERGKPEEGKITIALSREGTEVVLRFMDDGAGIDLSAVRQRARERNLFTNESDLTDDDVLQFILESGFSTASQVDQISGRGVGMDVVNREIKQMGGSLHIHSEAGKGSTFEIRLPFTLAISQTLLVRVGEELYATPTSSIEGVVRIRRQALEEAYSEELPTYEYAGQTYHLRYLGSLIGKGERKMQETSKWYPGLLVRSGEHRVALQVDGLLGNRETVIKSVGPQLSNVRWISGGSLLGDGRVVLILDPTVLIRMDAARPAGDIAAAMEQAQAGSQALSVMVVDDSITVRKVTARLMERHGHEVVTAKDGVDAFDQLQERIPDIILLDVEMPRMDGFELATHIRNSERLKNIPIIMITSRTGDKHRNRAMEIGVNRYLGKPYQESELLSEIYNLLDEVQTT